MSNTCARLRVVARGLVQGVGFRPFVHRLACELRLTGHVRNTGTGVEIEVEGADAELRSFLARLHRELPPHACLQSVESWWLPTAGSTRFEILPSEGGSEATALVMPDIATCPECLRELLDPGDRRFAYPFTNCTRCGPRFSIIEGLPYDRANTTMRGFVMCDACRAEYEDPSNRRFHAQPNACPACGPRIQWCSGEGRSLVGGAESLAEAVRALRDGRIVAVKGIGGFHLMVAAGDPAAVRRLRARKQRDEKPFAVMAATVEDAREWCAVSSDEERVLLSPAAPIVLLRRRDHAAVCDEVAPGNPNLGLMLSSNPLHHLLLRHFGGPLVATSGNLSDEPICIRNREAFERLAGIADGFLVHDRPIARHVDDSVTRVVLGREMVLRRGRGHAPLPVALPGWCAEAGRRVIALGPMLKNTVSVTVGGQVVTGQHIGDLGTEAADDAFRRSVADLPRLFGVVPETVACDLHPDYPSTRHAEVTGLPVVAVQHHHAHALACMAENGVAGPCLAVVWDGTGHGTDGTIWGGEFLAIAADGDFSRFAHLRTFPLPGGDRAAREPRRAAFGALHEVGLLDGAAAAGWRPFDARELGVLEKMVERGVNTVATSSAGRMVDAVASLLGIRQMASHEAQAAMELEFAAEAGDGSGDLPAAEWRRQDADGPWVIDWLPWLRGIVAGLGGNRSPGSLAAAFHRALAAVVVEGAMRWAEARGAAGPVVLSGGCFQNRILLEQAVHGLRGQGFDAHWHQMIPPNDGGVSLGQVVAAVRGGPAGGMPRPTVPG